MTDASFRAQVISTVAQIQNIYWDLVNAYEDLKVQQTALEFAQRTLTDNKKQVEIGTLAPIEVVSAQSAVATATQKLITVADQPAVSATDHQERDCAQLRRSGADGGGGDSDRHHGSEQ